ncbi:MAG: ferrochelatase [FCB group bacterium]|nr:ferrochelatase [FCB group bacterium]
MTPKKYAVVIANLGAPSKLDDVRPFLKQLFRDPDIFHFPFGETGQKVFSSLIATLRAPRSKKYYAAIGKGSPLHANTLAQAEKLQSFLGKQEGFTVFVAQRYWHPFVSEVVKKIRSGDFRKIILLPLYPQYSTTTTLSFINEWNRCADGLPAPIVIEHFYHIDGYLNAVVKEINKTLKRFETYPHILFSAHSIPVKLIANGDPYEIQIKECVEMVMDRLGGVHQHSICYQSKVGPVEWLSPSVESAIDSLVAQGIRHVLVCPISFVSENVETLYELDNRVKQYALDKGIHQYERARTVQDDDEFILSLKDLILEAIQ